MALALQDFVLHGEEWPMNAAMETLADLDFSDVKCDGEDGGDIELINKTWESLAKLDDLKTWEKSEYDYEPEIGLGDIEDVMKIFGDDGFDTNGFNRSGLDEEGIHFERQHLIYDLTYDEDRCRVERTIVEGIKEAMKWHFQRLSGVQPEFKIGELDWEEKEMCQNSKTGDTV